MENSPSFFSRLAIAFKLIFSGQYATQVLKLDAPVAPNESDVNKSIDTKEANYDSALQLLAILQKEGRLIDFVQEDVNQFSDEQVAAAARVVHQGVKKGLADHVTLLPASDAQEGSSINLPADFDRAQYRLTGNVSGQGPFHGTLIHKGWKVEKLTLPAVVVDTNLDYVAPAEVEV